jgi:hypothetical protein
MGGYIWGGGGMLDGWLLGDIGPKRELGVAALICEGVPLRPPCEWGPLPFVTWRAK